MFDTRDDSILELVLQARAGSEQAVGALARRVEGPVYAYTYRVTLDPDLAQDIRQEVLLTMVRSLSSLDHPDRFWPWLFRIAQSKVKEHFRLKQRRTAAATIEANHDFETQAVQHSEPDGMEEASRNELIDKVIAAMKHLSERYRAVLSLRCFEQLSYADIAMAMDCSEVKARVTFYRAKEALRKQLSREGLERGTLVLCLGLFGKVTTPGPAASSVTVPSAAIEVTPSTVIMAYIPSGLILAAAALLAVTLGTMGPNIEAPAESSAVMSPVNSFHFTTQLQYTGPEADESLSKGAYEQWFVFPEGLDGPMLFRMQRWDAQQTEKLCGWLQDANANYYYASGENIVYVTNCRVCWSSLRVRRLPTDDAEFAAFLDRAEGPMGDMVFTRDPQTGRLTECIDYRFTDAYGFRTAYEYNTLNVPDLDAGWPHGVPVVDERDMMHERGWTYFRIHGRVGEYDILGRGQIPFVYGACRDHPAWLSLRIGEDIEIADGPDAAMVRSADGHIDAVYPPGTFFEGLARPWMGMHTLDIIRRDAVNRRIRFATPLPSDPNFVDVTLRPQNGPTTAVTYTVDANADVVNRIGFEVNHRAAGQIEFTYLQDIEGVEGDFPPPEISPDVSTRPTQKLDTLWLLALPQGLLSSP